MTRKVLSVLLLAAVVVYPAAFLETSETATRELGQAWSGETYDSMQGAYSPEAPKAPLGAPLSSVTTLPSASLLHQKLILEDSEIVSNFGGGTRLGRSPPHA